MNALWGAGGFIGRSVFNKHHDPVFHGDRITLPGKELPEKWKGIIWCAGWGGTKNIDDVESDPVRAMLQNIWEPLELVRRCIKYNKRILIMSSGCLFDGMHPSGRSWNEKDAPNFKGGVYHQTKKLLEQYIEPFIDEITIFRIRLPFDGSKNSRNSLHKMASFPEVWDKEQSFTYLPDLARAVSAWERKDINGGIWHVVQPGTMNNYDAVRKHLNPGVGRVSGGDRPDKSMECPRSASILDCSKLQSVINLVPVKEAWASACEEYRLTKISN